MNSNNNVDQAAALLMCSSEAADRLGVPKAKRVYLHAGTDACDTDFVSNRQDLHSSPAIRAAGRRVLELAGVAPSELDHVDLYSCFPSAVEVAAQEIGLSEERPLTVTGGLTFGGGPLNDYVMHAIARMTEVLRASPGTRGLVTGNGGFLTKHSFCLYSSEPPEIPYRHEDLQAQLDRAPRREAIVNASGAATCESYTVLYGADGPEVATAACLLGDGRRTWANNRDPELMHHATQQELCGERLELDGNGGFRLA
jgi:acetyl-CoA C-acetyltransferase